MRTGPRLALARPGRERREVYGLRAVEEEEGPVGLLADLRPQKPAAPVEEDHVDLFEGEVRGRQAGTEVFGVDVVGVLAAVSHAFESAFSTILKGDTVTFLAAILLYALAIGQVRGFALTLGLATVIDVVVAYFYTRPATFLLARGPLGDGGRFSIRGAMGQGDVVTVEEPVEVTS